MTTLRSLCLALLLALAARRIAVANADTSATNNATALHGIQPTALQDTDDIDDFHVPGTRVHLNMVLRPPMVDRKTLGRLILLTNLSLFDYIEQHKAFDQPLIPLDDPYQSSISTHLYLEFQSTPRRNPHMTYGILGEVLQGLWLYLYMGRRCMTTGVDVYLEGYGLIALGAILSYVPDSISRHELLNSTDDTHGLTFPAQDQGNSSILPMDATT